MLSLVHDKLIELLANRRRLADAALLAGDMVNRANAKVLLHHLMMSAVATMPAEHRAGVEGAQAALLRKALASLHTIAGATGDAASARRVGEILLEELDDARSRMELVTAGLDAGFADAVYLRWLDEAEDTGADVNALRQRCDTQLARSLETHTSGHDP